MLQTCHSVRLLQVAQVCMPDCCRHADSHVDCCGWGTTGAVGVADKAHGPGCLLENHEGQSGILQLFMFVNLMPCS